MINKQWHKLGQLYCPSKVNRHPKLLTHASNPLPVQIEGNHYRIFYSGRDIHNRSSVGAIDIDIESFKVIEDFKEPFFIHGPKGSFFESGVSIGNCYQNKNHTYMLFMGWQTPQQQHWRGDIGRLILSSDLRLTLDNNSTTPFMSSDSTDPISLSYPWVSNSGDGGFDMWYGSTVQWDAGNGEMLHIIKHARSEDGENWIKTNNSVPHKLDHAQAFSHPTIATNSDGSYDMWFSYRCGTGQSYRIGHADSLNGLNWNLSLNKQNLSTSEEGWDSEMVEYPYIFDHNGSRYMLYNGNSNGKTGFGIAVLK